MPNKTITYTTKRGEKVTVDADSIVNHRALWSPSYHLADLMLAELGIDDSNTKIRNKFVGNIKASMSALHDGAVTAGEVEAYKKVKKVPAKLKSLIQLDKFDYAFKTDGIDINEYPMFLQVEKKPSKKTTKKSKTAAKRKVASAKVHKPNGFGNSVKISAIDDDDDAPIGPRVLLPAAHKISATDPIDAADKKAKFDAFVDMAQELGIDLAALTKS